jgi:hypothetical protein
VTAASFIGFTGFTLVMPFLPLYFKLLGVDDVGEIALWSGLSLGVTPGLTAMLARSGDAWRTASAARSWSSGPSSASSSSWARWRTCSVRGTCLPYARSRDSLPDTDR